MHRMRVLAVAVAVASVVGTAGAARAPGLRRGDVVLFHVPRLAAARCGGTGAFVQRIIGVPGDAWSYRHGVVFIDGRRLSEPYLRHRGRDGRSLTLADIPPRGRYTRIPGGMFLMMGDNRATACDSRKWGLVPRAAIERVLKRG
jgi:signal peptidase I